MPITASVPVLPAAPPDAADRPAATRPLRHLPRRPGTATSVLRAITTSGSHRLEAEGSAEGSREGGGATPTGPAAGSEKGTGGTGLRGLTLRDLAAGGGGATLSWTLAAHLGLLGTATGTFLISVISAVAVAVAGDSLRGLRQMALRAVRSARERRVHRIRAARSRTGAGRTR